MGEGKERGGERKRTGRKGLGWFFNVAARLGMQIAEEATKALNWLSEKVALQEQAKKTDEPVLLSADILKKEDTLRRFAEPILSTPPPPPPKVNSALIKVLAAIYSCNDAYNCSEGACKFMHMTAAAGPS